MRKYKPNQVQLVHMINDVKSLYYFAERTAPPLGLLSIATYLNKLNPDIKIEILDNAVEDTSIIHNKISGDIVGLSVNLWNYEKSLEVANIAKEKGAIVVMGGHHATAIAKTILKKREYIDYVIVGDGESAFAALALGKNPSEINNLVYRINKEIIVNKRKNISLTNLSWPERRFVDLSPYIKNYQKALPKSPFKTYTTFYSHKGCPFKTKNNSCIFCGIQIDGYRVCSAEKSLKELLYLRNNFNINYVMDVGDNISKQWLRDFVKIKPIDLNISYTGYIRSDLLDQETADLLAKIPCYSIFLGIESGDENILKKSGKLTTPSDNLKAIKLLADNNIKIRLGIILGLPGENKKTLHKTRKHVDSILDIGNVEGIYTSIMVPLPGSPSFKMLLNYDGFRKILQSRDNFDIEHLKRLWIKSFTSISFDYVLSVEERLQKTSTPICQ